MSKNFKSWHGRSSKNEKSIKSSKSDSLHRLGTYYLSEIGKSSDSEYSEKDLQILLRQFDVFLSIVLGHLYRTGQAHSSVELFPKWINNQLTSGKKLEQVSILDIVQLLFLNLELPVDFQNEWRLLFSTKVDGESFSRCVHLLIMLVFHIRYHHECVLLLARESNGKLSQKPF